MLTYSTAEAEEALSDEEWQQHRQIKHVPFSLKRHSLFGDLRWEDDEKVSALQMRAHIRVDCSPPAKHLDYVCD